MIAYRFHNDQFLADGITEEEPEESLDELLSRYDECCRSFSEFQERKRKAEAPYVRTRVRNGREETYIDYDAWEEADEDSMFTYGMADFNGFNALDMMQYDIDLKIAYMNQRGENYESKQ